MQEKSGVPEEDVPRLSVGIGMYQLLLEGLQRAVVDVDGAAWPGEIPSTLLRDLSTEGDVEVPFVRLRKLDTVLFFHTWDLRNEWATSSC